MDKLYVTVKEHFPQFVQTDYPVFIAFVQAYYKWLEEEYQIDKIETVVDIDETSQEFVRYFRQQLDVYGLYAKATPFDIQYLKTIKEIYTSKGSEDSLVFLLKTVFGSAEDTKVLYPRDSILRASDGIWSQEQFITVRKFIGTLPQTVSTLLVEYEGGFEILTVVRIDIINTDVTRFYFESRVRIAVSVDQPVKIVVDGVDVYEGRIELSPSSIEVVNGGKSWQVGQLIIFPGTIKNTIARVAQTTNQGSLVRIEIVDHGYNHTNNESIIVSPYTDKPVGSSYEYDYDNATSTHTLTIFEYTDGTTENVDGIKTPLPPDSYFLENYTLDSYDGVNVIQITSQNISTRDLIEIDSPITIEQWLESRARLRYIFDAKSSTRGKWLDSKGRLSDSYIRLQDNYYYQQYSYIIESNVLKSKYESLVNNVHVAGMILFSTLALKETLDIDLQVTTDIPFKYINVLDVANTDDVLIKDANKILDDNATGVDTPLLNFTKYDDDSLLSEDELSSKHFVGGKTDDASPTDTISSFSAIKILEDLPEASESIMLDLERDISSEVSSSDAVGITAQKAIVDDIESTDAIGSMLATKQLTQEVVISETASKDVAKLTLDEAQAFQQDLYLDYDEKRTYFTENYVVYGIPASLETTLS